ncbi:hypothetical protein SB761_26680, partial [Pseudomonas sp. SIMBA_064]
MEEAACQQHAFPSRHQWRGFSEQILMKILGAAVAIPDSATTAQSCANDYAIKAARQALLQAGCLPSELDLIVSLSISPSRMADAPT